MKQLNSIRKERSKLFAFLKDQIKKMQMFK